MERKWTARQMQPLLNAAPDLYEALEELAEKMAAHMDDETVRVVASALRKARGEA